jgi:hypothetical protein
LNFLDKACKTVKYQNLIEIRPVVAELFHADRRTDTTKLTVDIRNFASLQTNLKIENFLVATCHQDAPEVAPHFCFRTGKVPVETLIRIPKAVNLDIFSCSLDPSRQR